MANNSESCTHPSHANISNSEISEEDYTKITFPHLLNDPESLPLVRLAPLLSDMIKALTAGGPNSDKAD